MYAAARPWPRRALLRRAVPIRQRRLSAAGHQHRQPCRGRPRENAAGRAGRRRLLRAGERPAILSRGYAPPARRPTAWSWSAIPSAFAPISIAPGDEPLMLARQLDGVAVLVSVQTATSPAAWPSTISAARSMCWTTGSSISSCVGTPTSCRSTDEDVRGPWTLPAGRLREPLDAAALRGRLRRARRRGSLDAVAGRTAGVARAPRGSARRVSWTPSARAGRPATGRSGRRRGGDRASPARLLSVIARSRLDACARELSFRDHHRFSARDIAPILEPAR